MKPRVGSVLSRWSKWAAVLLNCRNAETLTAFSAQREIAIHKTTKNVRNMRSNLK